MNRPNKKSCKDDKTYHEYEKIRKLKVKDLCVLNASLKNVDTNNLNVKNTLTSTNIVVNDLQATLLNGKEIGCEQNFKNINSQLITSNPLAYPMNSEFNKKVWDNLVLQTLEQQTQLATRLQCGRLQEKLIQDSFGCVVCPPNELAACFPTCTNSVPGEVCPCPTEVGACPSIPLHIFGIKSVSPVIIRTCGSSLEQQTTQLISTISYNLDVTNVTGTLATRVVTLLVQVGYLDGAGNFVYEEIDFGNRQFGPTLDTAYGEKYTGTVILDTDLMSSIVTYPNSGAMVQLVVFSEDGVEIDVRSSRPAKSARSISSLNTTNTANGAVDTQFVGQVVGGQLQWANIYSYYNSTVSSITSLETRLFLSQGANDTQWVFGWIFDGPPPSSGGAGGYFGVNVNASGGYQFLGSIFNVALSASIAQPWVSAIKFGGEGEGWSLRIEPGNLSNFPFTIGEVYKFRINRQSTTDTTTVWEFIITNVTLSTSVNLGTITTSNLYSTISQNGIYQFSEYFGPGAPTVTCDTIPLTVATWSFPVVNDVPNSTTYTAWTPPPQHCGPYKIDPTLPNGPVVMSFGQGALQ